MCSVTMTRNYCCDVIWYSDVRGFVGTVLGLSHWSVSSYSGTNFSPNIWLIGLPQDSGLWASEGYMVDSGTNLDGWLREGDSEVLVVIQLMIMQHDQSLDGLLYRCQLHESHLPVLPVTWKDVTLAPHVNKGSNRKYDVIVSRNQKQIIHSTVSEQPHQYHSSS